MKKLALLLALVLVLAFAAPALAELNTSEHVTLLCWFMGDAPNNGADVLAQANKILTEKYNCELEMHYTGWSDWATVYQLHLTSGEPLDIIYVAAWADCITYANKGFFTNLEDYLPTYAPGLYAMYNEQTWKNCSAKGHIFCVPAYQVTYSGGGLIYRSDVLDAWGVKAPTDMASLEAYCDAAVANVKDVYPLAQEPATYMTDFDGVVLFDIYSRLYGIRCGVADNATQTPDLAKIEWYWGSEKQLADIQRARDWLAKGYFSQNLMSNKIADSANDYLEAGSCFVTTNGNNIDKWIGVVNYLHDNGSANTVGYSPFNASCGYTKLAQPTQDACAIPFTSTHKELACAVLQEIYSNKELNRLLRYGIEGIHYTINADGSFTDNAANEDFNAEGFNAWCWRNEDFALVGKSYSTPFYTDMKAYLSQFKTFSPAAFAWDTAAIETQIAQVTEVEKTYLEPLLFGLSNGLGTTLQENVTGFMQKANDAGLQDIWNSFEEQWTTWCGENGY
jgi:putative aldouronate transport system substrate-binding protein